MSVGKNYLFSNKQEIYKICGEVLKSIKNTKNLQKMKHVRRYDMVYTLYDANNNVITNGNASKNWTKMKDELNQVNTGRLNVQCIEITY